MDLQEYIENNSDYLSKFKEHGLKVQKDKNLSLVKYHYDKPPAVDSDFSWKRYCRGAVIDTDTHRVVCVPPAKAHEVRTKSEVPESPESSEDTEYQVLIDGTMINVFHHGGKWRISTRSEIGGRNKWLPGDNGEKLSFRDMFFECLSPESVAELDPKLSYSFVMRHRSNRNVSPVYQNEAYLVEVYSYGDTIQRVPHSEYPRDVVLLNESVTDRETFMGYHENEKVPPMPYHCKGYTVKIGSKRYKRVNPMFKRVQHMKGQTNNPCLNYIILRQSGNLKEYIQYFPEDQSQFNEYRDKIHTLSNDLYTTYKNTHIYKTDEIKDIPYYMKPLVYELHGIYLRTKQPTTWFDIKDYIYTMPPKKLMFSLNYMGK
jgi:hypothetical protein